MKRGTPDHWKMKELSRRLKIPSQYGLLVANGIMERLWHYTAKMHPRGDIGSSPDWAIADACAWNCGKRSDRPGHDNDKAAAFVDALAASGWLDRDKDCRYLVHDWAEHADNSVKKLLKEKGLSFKGKSSTVVVLDPALALPKPEPKPLAGEPPAEAKSTPPGGITPRSWERFMALYESTGKPMNEGDWMRAGMVVAGSDLDEESFAQKVLPCLESELFGWRGRAPDKIAFPHSWLSQKPWTRKSSSGFSVWSDMPKIPTYEPPEDLLV